LQDIVQNVIRSNQLYKTLGFIEATELHSCVIYAELIYLKLLKEMLRIEEKIASNTFTDPLESIHTLQDIVRDISTLISLYGCDTLDNLSEICIGQKFSTEANYVLLNKYVKPVRYRILDWRTKLKPEDEDICKTAANFECFDFADEIFDINFYYRIYGIKIAIHNMEKQHTLLVYGVIEDMITDFIENSSIKRKLEDLYRISLTSDLFKDKTYERFVNCLTLKELLVHSTPNLQAKYLSYGEQFVALNKNPLSHIINEFVALDLYEKRRLLIVLLLHSAENECHYLAYLLYDLLSNDINGLVDTYEQTMIYDSLPYNVKKYFRDGMKQIVSYTNKLANANISKISLEQRICLLKTSDNVKEKAMIKLKEVKMKTEDTASKAMQFLDGLLKIPFEIYKEEPVLKLMRDSIKHFTAMVNALSLAPTIPFPFKSNYTSLEIQTYLPLLKGPYKTELYKELLRQAKTIIATYSKHKLIECYQRLQTIAQHCATNLSLKWSGKTVKQMREELSEILDTVGEGVATAMTDPLYEMLETIILAEQKNTSSVPMLPTFNTNVLRIEQNIATVNTFMGNVTETLDKSVYGHTNAKRQIERIIGQWMNGDLTGYCFGFEGPPGVGKTSLAKKGIAQCLRDENGVERPFAFIAMGGSTNSSTLDGHNYTYVGSTWGRIVDILMDTKIMNPIIFIDELDKVSKTENGKEIIGILTHLIDQTQNDTFQDKYFNGINLNLSKALFIFSYNDPELIDKILLDRIHRIKFDMISVDDKLIITRNFILPEIYKKMGLENMIEFSDTVIEYIINDYTAEPGVRKLKELMFEIVGEINLAILKKNSALKSIPIVITIDDLKTIYLKDHTEIRPTKIHAEPLVGVINGMWANSAGKGGILPIEASYYPCNTFLELKLTGMQGDVMKESMTVAKSLAWSLVLKDPVLKETLEKNQQQGVHIHVPEGATPKDGPSAGTAITMVLYSLFSGRPINNTVAITGEICLQGRVTAIGGLTLKIVGGLRAGVKTFIYPNENEKDFAKFMKTYATHPMVLNVQFIAVERIEEVIPLIF
jgi:ATP-dependent Lon protease